MAAGFRSSAAMPPWLCSWSWPSPSPGRSRPLMVKIVLFAGYSSGGAEAARARATASTANRRRARSPLPLWETRYSQLLLAGVVANATPPAPAVAAEVLLGPPPLKESIARGAGLAGQLNVELASDGTRLDVRAFAPSGPVPGTQVDLTLRPPDGTPSRCCPGHAVPVASLSSSTSTRGGRMSPWESRHRSGRPAASRAPCDGRRALPPRTG